MAITREKTYIEPVEHFLTSFEDWCNNETEPSMTNLDACLSRNFSIKNNGAFLAKTPTDYLKYVSTVRSKFKMCKIQSMKESYIIHDNKVILQFQAIFTDKNGQKHTFYKMAVATIENDKVSNWEEVTHEKGLI